MRACWGFCLLACVQATKILEDLEPGHGHGLASKAEGLRRAIDGEKMKRVKAQVLDLIEDARRELGCLHRTCARAHACARSLFPRPLATMVRMRLTALLPSPSPSGVRACALLHRPHQMMVRVAPGCTAAGRRASGACKLSRRGIAFRRVGSRLVPALCFRLVQPVEVDFSFCQMLLPRKGDSTSFCSCLCLSQPGSVSVCPPACLSLACLFPSAKCNVPFSSPGPPPKSYLCFFPLPCPPLCQTDLLC